MTTPFTRRRLNQLARKICKTRILVIGDVMLDEFVWGKVSRISPEAPVPVVHVTSDSAFPGGAANVARNLADFGIRSGISGIIGKDLGGARLKGLLKEDKIDTQGLVVDSGYPTILKTRIIARQQQVVRVDREAPLSVSSRRTRNLISFVEKKMASFDAIILEDYGKGLFSQEILSEILSIAGKKKKIVTADPHPGNPLQWNGVTLLKPNRQEAYLAAGVPFQEDEKSLRKVGRILQERWELPYLLITLGECGMMLFEGKNKPYHIPTRAREVFDLSGAGDTVIAFLTAAMAAGSDIVEAAEIANHAAGVVVGKLGTATLTKKELFEHVFAEG